MTTSCSLASILRANYCELTVADDPIEGEVIREDPGKSVAARDDNAGAVKVFNPLDAEPVSFKQQLENRQENYDALKMHLRGELVPGKDFARLHIASKQKCPEWWNCSPEIEPRHWSDWQLLAPGADKVLGILGLGVHYPDLKDYKRAVLQGHRLEDVIVDCQILGHAEQVIAEGAGACSREEMDGKLNNAIKRACKRARLDAVHRLPVVSALFEADFLKEIVTHAAQHQGNTTAGRARQVKHKWDTGVRLEVCPITRDHKGKKWRDVPTDTLAWIVREVTDKPDVSRAAVEELSKRTGTDSGTHGGAEGSGSTHTQPSPAFNPEEEYLNENLDK